jgi:hypothetical protein
MNRWLAVAGMMMAGTLFAPAQAEDIQLFQASKAGEEAWVWGSAREAQGR